MRQFIALTPIAGAIIIPIFVPLVIKNLGLGYGLIFALIFSTVWFVAMLRTAEMPH